MTLLHTAETNNSQAGLHCSDLVAYTKLFEENRQKSLKHAYRFFLNRHDAEDAVEDAYIRCMKHWGRSCLPENFITYVQRVITNLSHDRHRKKKELQPDEPLEKEDTLRPMDFLEMEDQTAMSELLNELEPKYREPLILCALQDMTHEEAAKVLQISLPALKSRLYRARQELKQRIPDPSIWVSSKQPSSVRFVPTEKPKKSGSRGKTARKGKGQFFLLPGCPAAKLSVLVGVAAERMLKNKDPYRQSTLRQAANNARGGRVALSKANQERYHAALIHLLTEQNRSDEIEYWITRFQESYPHA